MKIFISILILLISVSASAQQNNDTLAIKQLLEKESATWRAGDIQGHADCWFIQPYSKILVSLPNGKCYDIDPINIVHPAESMVGKGGSAINSNYKFSIHANDAWVSHDEKSTAKDGSVTFSHEIRLLEKINNQWKLVGQSIHIYVP
jgi:hypothetical protein